MLARRPRAPTRALRRPDKHASADRARPRNHRPQDIGLPGRAPAGNRLPGRATGARPPRRAARPRSAAAGSPDQGSANATADPVRVTDLRAPKAGNLECACEGVAGASSTSAPSHRARGEGLLRVPPSRQLQPRGAAVAAKRCAARSARGPRDRGPAPDRRGPGSSASPCPSCRARSRRQPPDGKRALSLVPTAGGPVRPVQRRGWRPAALLRATPWKAAQPLL